MDFEGTSFVAFTAGGWRRRGDGRRGDRRWAACVACGTRRELFGDLASVPLVLVVLSTLERGCSFTFVLLNTGSGVCARRVDGRGVVVGVKVVVVADRAAMGESGSD